MSREELYRQYPLPSRIDSSMFPRRRPPPDAFPADRWPEDSPDRKTDHSPDRETEWRDRMIEAKEQALSDSYRQIGRLEARNDYLQDENTSLRAENERLKSREVPGPESGDSDEPSGFADRERPREAESSDNETPDRTWMKRPPSDKATAVGVAAIYVANQGAVLGHVMSSDLGSFIGVVAGLGGAGMILARDHWEKKHGD